MRSRPEPPLINMFVAVGDGIDGFCLIQICSRKPAFGFSLIASYLFIISSKCRFHTHPHLCNQNPMMMMCVEWKAVGIGRENVSNATDTINEEMVSPRVQVHNRNHNRNRNRNHSHNSNSDHHDLQQVHPSRIRLDSSIRRIICHCDHLQHHWSSPKVPPNGEVKGKMVERGKVVDPMLR